MGSAVTTATGKAEKRNYGLIDILKLLCAALVVAIHVPPFLDVHGLINFAVVNYIARIAVPFFFVSSAYFLFLKAYDKVTGVIDKGIILGYALRIIRLYAIWSLIYMPFVYHGMTESGGMGILEFLGRFAFKFIFSASYGHLWYLNAIIFSYLLIYAAISFKISLKAVGMFSFIMYCIGLCGQGWYGLAAPLLQAPFLQPVISFLGSVFVTTRNGLCEGLMFIMIGIFFAVGGFRMKLKAAVLGLIASFAFLGVEIFTLTRLEWIKGYDMYLGLIPAVFFLFYVCLAVEIPYRPIYRNMRTLSSLIYYLHMIPAEALLLIPVLRNLPGGSVASYVFVLTVTVLISLIIMKLSERFPVFRLLFG